MIKTIIFKNSIYPAFQAEGNAAQFVIPFAKHLCLGSGVDIGCHKEEWAFPGSKMVDLVFNNGEDAFNFKGDGYDYVFSSHCLEHLENWTVALDYWKSKIKTGGVMFLYLPDFSQEYWRPWNNRKHLHSFTPELLNAWFTENGFENVFVSGVDLNNSFVIIGSKK